jgi:tripeptide aminopeptidase
VQIKESYRNMKLDLSKNPKVVEMAIRAAKAVGLEPKLTSIRGGTDGSRLSAMGLLTPNVCGGGKNFHSKQEWIAVPVMEQSARMLMELVYLWGA